MELKLLLVELEKILKRQIIGENDEFDKAKKLFRILDALILFSLIKL